MSGYVTRVVNKGTEYEIHTVEGVRGLNVPAAVLFTPEDSIFSVILNGRTLGIKAVFKLERVPVKF